MGSANARQQALSQTRVSGGASDQAASSAGVALDPAAACSAGAGDDTRHPNWEDDRIPVVFTWTHGGQDVLLAASFNGWREPIPMVRSGNEFSVVKELPRGVHQYRFMVDNDWRHAPDQQTVTDPTGNVNNVIDISQYQRFQIKPQSELDANLKYTQTIPDPADYSMDAPVIPQVLHKSHIVAMPPRPHITGGQVLTIPHHSLCDHFYVQEKPCPRVSTSVAVTHRYNQKYSTMVYITKDPSASPRFLSSKNFFKAAAVSPKAASSEAA